MSQQTLPRHTKINYQVVRVGRPIISAEIGISHQLTTEGVQCRQRTEAQVSGLTISYVTANTTTKVPEIMASNTRSRATVRPE